MKINFTKGFTLIELLVVIAIIGLLSSVVLASLNGARVKARDAKRMQDLHEIDNAIQLYITSNNHAPYLGRNCAASALDSSCNVDSVNSGSWNLLKTDLQPYLKGLAVDPVNTGGFGYYAYVYAAPADMSASCNATTATMSGETGTSDPLYISRIARCTKVYGDNNVYGLYAYMEANPAGGWDGGTLNGVIYSKSTPRGFLPKIFSHP